MTKTTAKTPAVAAPLPNASIDFNKVLANDAKGKTGGDVFDGALQHQQKPADHVADTPAADIVDKPSDAA